MLDFWNEMESVINRVKSEDMLGTDNVKVISCDQIPATFFRTPVLDRPIHFAGISLSTPYVHNTRPLAKDQDKGYGLMLMETIEDKLKYVLYTYKEQYGKEAYLIVDQKNTYKLMRHIKSMERRFNKCERPILDPGLLDKILDNTIGFINQSRKIKDYGVNVSRGILLGGPPGNGKTMICRYIKRLCIEKNIKHGLITASQIEQAYQRNSMEELFNRYQVSFFDDIDISFLSRSASGDGRKACALLAAMNGVNNIEFAVRIFTTNENVKSLDSAFLRPSRIDWCVHIEKPNESLRRKMIHRWDKRIIDNIDVERLVVESHNLSFAELDEIRTILVTNHILNNKPWDIDAAMDEFCFKSGKQQENSFGFKL